LHLHVADGAVVKVAELGRQAESPFADGAGSLKGLVAIAGEVKLKYTRVFFSRGRGHGDGCDGDLDILAHESRVFAVRLLGV
jgi:hypothetical protein